MLLISLLVVFSIFSLIKSGVIFENGIATLTISKGTVPKEEVWACDFIPTESVLGGKKLGYITRIDHLPDTLYTHHILVESCHIIKHYVKQSETCPICEKLEVLSGWSHGNKGYASDPVEFPPRVSKKLNSSETEFIRYQVNFIDH